MQKIEYSGLAPSFSIYSSDSITSRAVARVIREEDATLFHEHGHVDGDDFEFESVLSNGESSFKYSSSEADEFESPRSGSKSKKSRSTGSGSKRWIFRYLLRRSNETKKVDNYPKQKRNSGEVLKVGYEQFYVQKRAENEVGKRRSYRQDLVGLFANVNGMGKMILF